MFSAARRGCFRDSYVKRSPVLKSVSILGTRLHDFELSNLQGNKTFKPHSSFPKLQIRTNNTQIVPVTDSFWQSFKSKFYVPDVCSFLTLIYLSKVAMNGGLLWLIVPTIVITLASIISYYYGSSEEEESKWGKRNKFFQQHFTVGKNSLFNSLIFR